MSFYATYPIAGGSGVPTYANLAAFPSAVVAGNGALAIALDTDILYISNGTIWEILADPASGGSAITALTGDGTATGPGSVPLTLATVNSNVGTFGTASSVSTVTVNAKGLTTAAASTSIQIAESQVTNLVSDLAAKQSTTLTSAHLLVGNVSNVATDVAASGDLTLANTGAFTLATVNSNVGSFGSASSVGTFTVNAKGLTTAAASTSIQIAESQVTNLVSDLAAKQSTTLTNTHILVGNGSNVATDVAMSGDTTIANTGAVTIANLAVTNAKIANTTIDLTTKVTGALPIANGGTGQTTANPAFNALSPLTTKGDIIGFSTVNARLPVGSNGQILTADSGQTLGVKWADNALVTQSTAGLVASAGQLLGTNTNDSAAAGYVGEEIVNSVTGISIGSSVAQLATITLTAGDWDLCAMASSTGTSGSGAASFQSAINTTTASFAGTNFGIDRSLAALVSGIGTANFPPRRISIASGTAPYFLNVVLSAISGTDSVNGYIRARRMR